MTVFKYWKRGTQAQIIYLVKISFNNKGEIRTFSEEGKLRDFVSKSTVEE